MAASRNMALLGLLMACVVCASASAAGSVAPVETMKVVDLGVDLPVNLDVSIKIKLKISLLEWLPYEDVKAVVTGAGVQVVPFTFVDGVVSLVKTISVRVSVGNTAPLKVTVTIGSVKVTVRVPLAVLGSGVVDVLNGSGDVTDVVSGALMLVKTTAGGVLLIGGATDLKFIETIIP